MNILNQKETKKNIESENVTRNSNFELLRILSMLFIVIYHMIIHGRVFEDISSNSVKEILTIIEFLIIIHVNLFVLITGYFQSESNFKQSKFWSIINSSLFYKLIIIIVLSLFGIISLNKLTILKELFIINLSQYWFIKVYLFLYCLSPFINILIRNITRKNYQKLIIVLFVLFSVIPYITGEQGFENNGYTLYNFIFLYLVGGYLRKYPLENSYFMRRFSKNLVIIFFVSIYIFAAMLNYSISKTCMSLLNINTIMNEISNNVLRMTLMYSNPLIIIQSITFFYIFKMLKFKSSFVNSISRTTLGVYLIHDNNYIRKILYDCINIHNSTIDSYWFILYLLLMSIIVFVCCSIIEWLRQLVFKFIYTRKVSKKIRDNYYNWIHSIRIEKIENAQLKK